MGELLNFSGDDDSQDKCFFQKKVRRLSLWWPLPSQWRRELETQEGETGETVETGKTGETGETVKTGETGEAVETVKTGVAVETVKGGGSGETGNKGKTDEAKLTARTI